MEAAIFNCQCDQMQNFEGGCETIYYVYGIERMDIKRDVGRGVLTTLLNPLQCVFFPIVV